MKKWLLNNKLTIFGVFFGAIGGYLYYYFVGCASGGTCAITSSPINSTLYFSMMGGLILSIFKSDSKKANDKIVEYQLLQYNSI
jgi:phage shock protein E